MAAARDAQRLFPPAYLRTPIGLARTATHGATGGHTATPINETITPRTGGANPSPVIHVLIRVLIRP